MTGSVREGEQNKNTERRVKRLAERPFYLYYNNEMKVHGELLNVYPLHASDPQQRVVCKIRYFLAAFTVTASL